jgi:hypothetical protein
MKPIYAIAASLLALALVSPTGALADDPPAKTLIRNVNIFDGVNDSLAEGMVTCSPCPVEQREHRCQDAAGSLLRGKLRDFVVSLNQFDIVFFWRARWRVAIFLDKKPKKNKVIRK